MGDRDPDFADLVVLDDDLTVGDDGKDRLIVGGDEDLVG